MTPVELRSMADTLGGRRDAILSRLKTASAREESLVQRKAAIDALMLAVQKAARDTQDQLRVRIEDVVQTALDAVFPSMHTFRTEFVARRGRTELDMWLDKDGTRMDPLDSNGGGVVDVLSLSLRIGCLTMSGKARVLLLDEPFKFIRGRARQRLGDMLSRLSRRLGIQVIMVSDVSDTGIIPDREFRVSLDRSRHSVVTMTESEATEA
jgi:hypothetical protein